MKKLMLGTVVGIALNLLYGACIVLRRQSLRQQGVNLPDECFATTPQTREELETRMRTP